MLLFKFANQVSEGQKKRLFPDHIDTDRLSRHFAGGTLIWRVLTQYIAANPILFLHAGKLYGSGNNKGAFINKINAPLYSL